MRSYHLVNNLPIDNYSEVAFVFLVLLSIYRTRSIIEHEVLYVN